MACLGRGAGGGGIDRASGEIGDGFRKETVADRYWLCSRRGEGGRGGLGDTCKLKLDKFNVSSRSGC